MTSCDLLREPNSCFVSFVLASLLFLLLFVVYHPFGKVINNKQNIELSSI